MATKTKDSEKSNNVAPNGGKRQQLYLVAVIVIGLGLQLLSLFEVHASQLYDRFLLFVVLAIVSSFATTTVPDLSFEIGSAISIASIPLFGPFGAILVMGGSTTATWYLSSRSGASKGTIEQLLFNVGMQSIAMLLAGSIYTLLHPSFSQLWPPSLVILWLIIAIVHDQVNFWLVAIIIRLKSGENFNPRVLWQENRWAMTINIFLLWLGGGLMAYASVQFGWSGIAAFFVPIALSAYAFQLYVRKMKSHMDNLEQIISERTGELKTLMREKDAFLAVLTHDMKTPLTSIGLYANMLESRPEIVFEKPHMVKIIARSQQTLLNIVNNILDIEKLQAGGSMNIDKEYFVISALIEVAVESLQVMAATKSITLTAHIENESAEILADEAQIERVLTNLISNGIKYSHENGNVCVTLRSDRHNVFVIVEDSGFGIPESELPYIFDSYRRVEIHKNVATGTGLGLAVVKAIVEVHDGSIAVESVEKSGSIFTITMPIKGARPVALAVDTMSTASQKA